MPARVSVFFNVRDLKRSVAFYKALGFKQSGAWPDDDGIVRYVDLELDGAEISVGDIAANDDPEFQKWVSGELGTGVLTNVGVPNVDAVYAKAKKAGATIEQALTNRPYGRLFILNDPDGYAITFVTEPARRAPKRAAKKAARKAPKPQAKRAGAKRSAKKAARKTARKARR